MVSNVFDLWRRHAGLRGVCVCPIRDESGTSAAFYGRRTRRRWCRAAVMESALLDRACGLRIVSTDYNDRDNDAGHCRRASVLARTPFLIPTLLCALFLRRAVV